MKENKCSKCGKTGFYRKRLSGYICGNSKCDNYKSLLTLGATEKPKEKTEKEKTVTKTEVVIKDIKSTADILSKKDLIPKSNGYISRKVYGTTDIKLLEGFYKSKEPLLIVGETGCGKTHALRNFCYQNSLPYRRISLNGGITADDLLGQYVPNDNKEQPLKWVDGWLTYFVRNGGVLVLDELNACNPDITMALHSITDDEKTITITTKDGETIRAHKDLWIVGTMNKDYEGTKELNEAFKDRFHILPWGYDSNVEKQLGIPDDVLNIVTRLRDMFKAGELSYPISTRGLIQYRDNKKRFNKKIARELFLNKFESEEEQKAVKELFSLTEKTGEAPERLEKVEDSSELSKGDKVKIVTNVKCGAFNAGDKYGIIKDGSGGAGQCIGVQLDISEEYKDLHWLNGKIKERKGWYFEAKEVLKVVN